MESPIPVTIIEKEWGANKLLDEITGKKCCLGFAALELGIPAGFITSRGLISSLPPFIGSNEEEKAIEDAHSRFSKNLSPELIHMLQDVTEDHIDLIESDYTLETLAAEANDEYHETGSIAKRTKLLEIMKQVFIEADLVFVLERSKK